jgi:hypothetical protein
MEWAATELYIATKDPEYLRNAIAYAEQAADNPWMGSDRHGHYEFFPYPIATTSPAPSENGIAGNFIRGLYEPVTTM